MAPKSIKDPRPLYAICFSRLRRGQVVDIEFEYVHASDQREAGNAFRVAHSRALCAKRIQIVEVAPALGYFSEDDNGDRLVM